jgi:hypothetical protein
MRQATLFRVSVGDQVVQVVVVHDGAELEEMLRTVEDRICGVADDICYACELIDLTAEASWSVAANPLELSLKITAGSRGR